jgi:transposase-like protein
LEPPLPTNATTAIAALRKSWHRLHDLDRALAVRDIVQLGVSRRRLARELGFNDGTIRRLLKTLKASSADQELARQHLISTNELIRRVNRRGETSAKETPGLSESQPVPAATKLRIESGLTVVPVLKRKTRSLPNSAAQIPPAAIKLLEMWQNRTGEY